MPQSSDHNGQPPKPRFPLGQVAITPACKEAIDAAGQLAEEFLFRHVSGDWGDVDSDDKNRNEHALEAGNRIVSAYETARGVKIWIITEADRSVTTLLLPEEY